MKILEEIRKSNNKPKELVLSLSNIVKKDKSLLKQFEVCLKAGNTAEKGICMEVLEFVSQEKPEFARPYIEVVIKYLADPAPKVKWEAARVIGNISSRFPAETLKAVPNLIKNTGDKGTVVRWSAAYALSEILKSNKTVRSKLLPQVESLLKNEKSNGVKNVYLKALKIISKEVSR